MNRAEFASRIDHTVLGPTTTPADVERVLEEAQTHGMNACVPPCYVAEAAASVPDVTLAAVVGFPHGTHATAAKYGEAVDAWQSGADEVDMVCNVGRLQAGDDFVKTSTGFADGGAVVEDVALMAEYLPVKASGGIGSYEAATTMLDAGAERIGASSGVAIVEGFPE